MARIGRRFGVDLRRRSRDLFGMKDLTSPFFIKLKGVLFLVIGLLAAVLLILEQPTLKVAALLALCVWCFCRFYYFAF
jgi:uncharacterized membrane protein